MLTNTRRDCRVMSNIHLVLIQDPIQPKSTTKCQYHKEEWHLQKSSGHMLFFFLLFLWGFFPSFFNFKKVDFSLILCPCAFCFHTGTDCQGTCCLWENLRRTEGELLSACSDESEKQGQKMRTSVFKPGHETGSSYDAVWKWFSWSTDFWCSGGITTLNLQILQCLSLAIIWKRHCRGRNKKPQEGRCNIFHGFTSWHKSWMVR